MGLIQRYHRDSVVTYALDPLDPDQLTVTSLLLEQELPGQELLATRIFRREVKGGGGAPARRRHSVI
jgi:hypothetical protein